MKTLSLFIAAAIAFSTPAFAAKGAKPAAKGEGKRHAGLELKEIDQNGNHQIDGAEVAVLKEKFAKLPADSRLKERLDVNKNGQLDDTELATLNQRLAKRGEHAGGKGEAHKKGKGKAA